ncbi:hypothetical protein F4777DRAFT_312802 [Nemania sp. FL0916]|nr:hypothetical protein F4777DRAFT_312802 [Nemania sp. FL0916]
MASAAGNAVSAEMASPPSPTSEAPSPTTPLPENASKERLRQRLFCGIRHMSSSHSLPLTGRSRSSSAPYGGLSNLSCVSVAPAGTSASSGSVTPGSVTSGHGSPSSTSGLGSGSAEAIDVPLAPRRMANVSSITLTPATSSLPADVTVSRPRSRANRSCVYDFWSSMPLEIRLHVLSFLKPKELVCIARVSKEFHKLCFDGQLWTTLDATEFYNTISAVSLANIISSAGPYIKNLNLRGCLQIEYYKRADVLNAACKNLTNVSLEGCRNFQRSILHDLIRFNNQLVTLNLTGMTAVTNSICKIISNHCPQLEALNVSWCKHMDARGVKMVVLGCPELKDLRASEIRGFDSIDVAQAIFNTNNLQRLVLGGCSDLTDDALKTMTHGLHPETDVLTGKPNVPPRKLRHLDLSRCPRLTDRGVKALGYLTPDLEGLQLSRCVELTDMALIPIIASTPKLTHLELDDLSELTNDLFSKHLAKAPCAEKLEHLSLSYCENVGDPGLLPIFSSCVSLRNVDMDNTRISNLVLAEAASMVRSRSAGTSAPGERPRVGLKLVAFDCNLVTWNGVHNVLAWNSGDQYPPGGQPTYPTEIIELKIFYAWQQTVQQHTKRVLRGDFAAASRLGSKWADYMQAVDEAGNPGAGSRRRRRRAREAQLLHENEEEGGIGGLGRRRARTMVGSCAIM